MVLVYYGIWRPLEDSFDLRLDILNEFLVGLCCVSLFPLTEWNGVEESRFNYSWILIANMQILIGVNMLNVFKQTYKSIKLLCAKYKLALHFQTFFKMNRREIKVLKH